MNWLRNLGRRSQGGGSSRALAEAEEQRLQLLEVRGYVWREVLDILQIRLDERRNPAGAPQVAAGSAGDDLAALLADDAAPPDALAAADDAAGRADESTNERT